MVIDEGPLTPENLVMNLKRSPSISPRARGPSPPRGKGRGPQPHGVPPGTCLRGIARGATTRGRGCGRSLVCLHNPSFLTVAVSRGRTCSGQVLPLQLRQLLLKGSVGCLLLNSPELSPELEDLASELIQVVSCSAEPLSGMMISC